MRSDLADAVTEQLAIFASASRIGWDAYRGFLMAGQRFDFTKAGELQLIASAHLDSAMDAFMACCWLQKQLQDRMDG